MVNRHVDGITGIPLDAGQDQETVVLPEMSDLSVIGDGNEVVTGFPIYILIASTGSRAPSDRRRVHVKVSLIPISSVLKNSHMSTVL